MDQYVLANDVSSKIKEEFVYDFLVKPLEVIKVKKEFSKLPENKKPVADKNDIEAIDIDEKIETEIKEVDSDFRKAIILKIPMTWKSDDVSLKVGDTVIYRTTAGRYYDLLKDSQLVRYYDIVGVIYNA